jgi:hypothetical protein
MISQIDHFTFMGLWVLIENLVHKDQDSNDVRHWFKALEEVLVVS